MVELFKKSTQQNLFKKANQASNLFKKVAKSAPSYLQKGADIAGKIKAQADIIEKQTRGTALEPVSAIAKTVGDFSAIAEKGLRGAGALSRGKTKEGLKEIESGVVDIKALKKKKASPQPMV